MYRRYRAADTIPRVCNVLGVVCAERGEVPIHVVVQKRYEIPTTDIRINIIIIIIMIIVRARTHGHIARACRVVVRL